MRASPTAPRRYGLTFAGVTASIASAAFLATACGTASAPGAPVKPAGVTLAQAHRATPADSRAGATADARQLLAGLRLPPGARKLPWPARPPAGLTPATPGIGSEMVDLKVLYRLSQPMSATDNFLLTHHPAGTLLDGSGQGSHSGTVTSESASFTAARLPDGIFSAELNTATTPGPGGGSLLRADAFVAWYPPRGTARRISPAAYTAVIIRWQHGYSVTTRTLTSRQTVLYFAGLYNGLHGAPEISVRGCLLVGTGANSNSYQIVFSPAHGQPRVVVSPACLFVKVSIGGRQVSELYPETGLFSAAERAVRRS
jgi:hypothetical protein